MQFHIIQRKTAFPERGRNSAYLRIDYWNDYSFVTMFEVLLFDENGAAHSLENVKIGFVGQTVETSTYSTLASTFEELPQNYFSLGTDVDYYKRLSSNLSEGFRQEYLRAMRDVVFDPHSLQTATEASP